MADKHPNPEENRGNTEEHKDDNLGGELTESFGSRSSGSDGLTSSSDSNSVPKRQRETSPSKSPVRSESPSASYRMVPPSPPKFVSLNEVMKAAHGIGNMMLAHEIAVDGDVQLQRNEPPPDSIEKKVGDVMKQAFWDALQEKLREDPPDYSHAIVLLEEVKQELLGLLLPQHNNVKTRINEVLDTELIEQQAEHGALDFSRYSEFVIDIMSKLCAPARDENITELKQIKEVVPLYKKVFEVIELMKLDMANFTLQQARPLIQQHAVEYERAKFEDFLKMQEENNLDGLQYTKEWLRDSFEALHRLSESLSLSKESPSQTATTPSSTTSPSTAAATPPNVTPGGVISHAYVQLLIWPDTRPLPETLLVDEKRLCILQEEIEKLTIVCGVLLVTYSTVGGPIAGVQSLKTTLKNHLLTILQDVPVREIEEAMPKIGEQVVAEVQKCLCEHGFPRMSEERVSLLKGQVTSTHKPDHPVYKLIRSRILSLVSQLLNLGASGGGRIQLPPGVSTVSEELQKTCASFMRIVTHNRAVFSQRYEDIIKTLEETREQSNSSS